MKKYWKQYLTEIGYRINFAVPSDAGISRDPVH
jgi:hypothetical protein